MTHIKSFHGHCPGVCPICVIEDHGDPNYVSKDLLGHIKLRHNCNYNELIDRQETEEETLARIINMSTQNY